MPLPIGKLRRSQTPVRSGNPGSHPCRAILFEDPMFETARIESPVLMDWSPLLKVSNVVSRFTSAAGTWPHSDRTHSRLFELIERNFPDAGSPGPPRTSRCTSDRRPPLKTLRGSLPHGTDRPRAISIIAIAHQQRGDAPRRWGLNVLYRNETNEFMNQVHVFVVPTEPPNQVSAWTISCCASFHSSATILWP